MPTGFTAFIEDGDITTAKDFIMLCAREFGATMSMRDEPLSTPIPETLEPETFYQRRLIEEQKRLETVRAMTLEDAEKKMDEDYRSRLESFEKNKKRKEELCKLYDRFTNEVRSWTPPTQDHQKLKEFALDQLRISRPDPSSLDKMKPTKMPADEWLEAELDDCIKSVKRYREYAKSEQERNESRNKWISDLRDSLAKM